MKREIYLPEEYHAGQHGRRKRAGKWFRVLLAVLLGLALTGSIVRAQQTKARAVRVQEALAEEVLRFHVLANSDSREDQTLKLKVRDAVLDYMREAFPEAKSAEETKAWAKGHLPEIEAAAEQTIAAAGAGYPVNAEVTRCDFPEKAYGDVVFPAGRYEALRVEIGAAKGHNWWCVLYPNLCFMDSVRAVVPEEGKEKLQETLTEEEYEMVTEGRELKIKWFFLGE